MQPGMPDLGQIVLRAQQMQDAVERANQSLAEADFSGQGGGGLVTAVVTGAGELRLVNIAPAAGGDGSADDLETLGDLVVAAVRDATAQARHAADQVMRQATGGFDLASLGLGGAGASGQPGPAGMAGMAGAAGVRTPPALDESQAERED